MDEAWFRKRQKTKGVTSTDIAAKRGLNRTAVSHILHGRQAMSVEWAKAFAEALDEPLDEVLKHAGVLDPVEAQQMQLGFSESDAAAYVAAPMEIRRIDPIVTALGGNRPGVDVWKVNTTAMMLAGYMPGDMMLVDQHAAERVGPGDVVIAQAYDWNTGTANTLLRAFAPPALVARSADAKHMAVHIVDGNNVLIRGKVIASWRK